MVQKIPGQKQYLDISPLESGRVVYTADPNFESISNNARADWQRMFDHQLEGTIVVVGDTSLKPEQNIEVIVLMPNGTPHYTSGVYRVNKVTHTITPGKFETKMELMSNGIVNATEYGGFEAPGITAEDIKKKQIEYAQYLTSVFGGEFNSDLFTSSFEALVSRLSF